MGNLLKLELKGLCRQFIFRALVVLMPVLGASLSIVNHSKHNAPSDGILELYSILSVMLSAFAGLYISRDFTQNTIRNKIVVGHSRWHIYLSKLSVVGMMYFVCLSLFILSVSVAEWLLIDKITLEGKALVLMLAAAMVCMSLTTAIAMTIRTDLGGLDPLLLLYLSMIFAGLGYEFIDPKIMDWINHFIPCGQLMMSQAKNLLLSISCSMLEALLLCAGGYWAFRNADLN